jgi:hypothetical protein
MIVTFRIQQIMADSKSATFNEMYLEGTNAGVEMPDSQKMLVAKELNYHFTW